MTSLSENDLWLLSYYRSSEINGALFFGRVARSLKPGPLQGDVTHHFADEANHAKLWTRCIEGLDANAIKLSDGYQDQYLKAVGLPANLMEVMAITQVFEKRVIGQYHRHLRSPDIHPLVRETIETIMEDERWHVKYVREALEGMAETYGEEHTADTLRRFTQADEEVYADTLAEYGERISFLREVSEDPEQPADPSWTRGYTTESGLQVVTR